MKGLNQINSMEHQLNRPFFLSFYFEIQSTLIYIREVFVAHSFEIASRAYVAFKKGPSWNVNTQQLLSYPISSLGYHLGCFLLKHSFEPQPRCENHDVFHVITEYKIDTAQEIAMQFWLYGNGKRSPFVLLAMFVGAMLYMDGYSAFAKAYSSGKQAVPVHAIDFMQHLASPISQFKN